MAVLSPEDVADHVALGELGLDGSLAPVAGVLPAAMGAVALGRGILCPAGNGGEAAWAGDLEVLAAPNLLALINHFTGRQVLSPPTPAPVEATGWQYDLRAVKDQETPKADGRGTRG